MEQLKPNYNINDLMDECISRYEDTFLLLRDTPDYLPQPVLDMIIAGIYKEMKRTWKKLRKYDKRFQRKLIGKKSFFQRFGQPRPMSKSEDPEDLSQEKLPVTVPDKEVQANVEE